MTNSSVYATLTNR
uniref:Uncharacterized protein n=1 Tax=Arundo donax TaxID=35708 RepID=A0A0A9AYW1_ARUDO